MPTPKDIYDREYKKNNYDNILVRVKKGKKDEYTRIADSFGLGQAEMIRLAIEEYIQNHGGEVTISAQQQIVSEPELTTEQKRLVEEFSKLPADTQKFLLKFLHSIGEKLK